jgi:hypothetical protein
MSRRTFRFPDGIKTAADMARLEFAVNVLRGWSGPAELIVADAKRSIAANAAFHAAVSDIADQVEWYGQKLPAGVWKRLLASAYLRERGEKPFMVPALDGVGVDVIYERTSQMSQKEMGELIEWTQAFGAEHECKFQASESWR